MLLIRYLMLGARDRLRLKSASPVQLFLAQRVKNLSGSWTVFLILATLSLTEFWSPERCDGRSDKEKSNWASSYVLEYSLCGSLEPTFIASHAETEYVVSRLIREAIETGTFASLFAGPNGGSRHVVDSPRGYDDFHETLSWQYATLAVTPSSLPDDKISFSSRPQILNSRKTHPKTLHDSAQSSDMVTQIEEYREAPSLARLVHQMTLLIVMQVEA
ncbi:hypothetical protein D9757_013258 [Collybiopsis confluens]|uniref:Uncharacterized protein n=1 Tax=Collybiopsis confluens TaxID=2823264 RepID=A0A8H5GQN1_9AGAR|nr:hypothetical protein D9757_013258 [Collybiopsis confluens]